MARRRKVQPDPPPARCAYCRGTEGELCWVWCFVTKRRYRRHLDCPDPPVAEAVDVAALATRRESLHEHHASSRPLSEGYELVGLRGEQEFARLTGLTLDSEDRLAGDAGRDFAVPAKGQRRSFTVDVKTARKPGHLIVEQGKVTADVYVLAGYDDATDTVTFLGWATGKAMRVRPVRDFGYGVVNHYLHAQALTAMDELLRAIRLRLSTQTGNQLAAS